MATKIKKLTIKGLRGIPECEITLDGKGLIIVGENGAGKSSFVDALELFFTGKISHLEGVQGLSLQKHGPHVNFRAQDVSVDLRFDPGNIALSRSFSSAPNPPAHLEPYFRVTQQGVCILRRAQILRFIASQPSDRFRAIGSIIGVEVLDKIELELMRLRDDLKAQVDSKNAEIRRLHDDVNAVTGVAVSDRDYMLPTLNAFLKRGRLQTVGSFVEAEKLSEKLLADVKQEAGSAETKALNELKDLKHVESQSGEISRQLADLDSKLAQLHDQDAKVQLATLEVLQKGQHVIDSLSLDYCPLCEQTIDRKVTLTRITDRLNTLTALSSEASSARQNAKFLAASAKNLSGSLDQVHESMSAVAELLTFQAEIGRARTTVSALEDHLVSAADLGSRLLCDLTQKRLDGLAVLVSNIAASAQGLLEKKELSAEDTKVLEVDRVIQRMKQLSTLLSHTEKEHDVLNRQFLIAREIYTTFSETKNSQIQAIYDNIQADIERFYSSLHPDESHKNIELSVVHGRRASTNLRLESFGRPGEDPRALCSEGHLDSLGLCIFLAFVRRFNEDCSLVVLDDVMTTVDASHRERVCGLLFQEFADKQLIITTHDMVWFKQLRWAQSFYGLDGEFVHRTIVAWDLVRGPLLTPFKGRWEWIEKKLAEGDKSGAGNAARQYLEWVLHEICFTTRAGVPMPLSRIGQYEVKDLLDATKARVMGLLVDDSYSKSFEGCIARLEATVGMGNILSHNNLLSDQLSMNDARSFCEAIRDVHNVFCCSTCGNMLRYNRDGKRIECQSPKCAKPDLIKTK